MIPSSYSLPAEEFARRADVQVSITESIFGCLLVVQHGNGVCLSTIQDTAGGSQQDPTVAEPVNDLDHTMNSVSIVDARPTCHFSGIA